MSKIFKKIGFVILAITSPIIIGHFQSGLQKQLDANPEIKANILYYGIIITFFIIIPIAIIPLIFITIRDFIKKQKLKKIGQKTTAKIIKIEDTGIRISSNTPFLGRIRLAEIKITTSINNTTATFRTQINEIPKIGDEIEIVYNPANPTEAMSAQDM